MALNERERRALQEIADAMAATDPAFVRRLTAPPARYDPVIRWAAFAFAGVVLALFGWGLVLAEEALLTAAVLVFATFPRPCGSRRWRVASRPEPTCNGANFLTFLKKAMKPHRGNDVHVVLDYLSTHTTTDVQEWLEDSPNVRASRSSPKSKLVQTSMRKLVGNNSK
jgi:hypothetical protein